MSEPGSSDEVREPWHGRVIPVLSWTYALAAYRKRGTSDVARARIITQMNGIYLLVGVVLALIAWAHGPATTLRWKETGAWNSFDAARIGRGMYCIFRVLEVGYAFYRDASDKLRRPSRSRSTLTEAERIRLALASYIELVLDFALLYSLLPRSSWRDRPPQTFADLLFYSASTITTSGGGGFTPEGVLPQAFTALEIGSGLILLVVCFAVYAGRAFGGDERTRVSPCKAEPALEQEPAAP